MTQSDITPTVLLTGPTRGIGGAMLRSLIGHPARPRLVLLARDESALERAVSDARTAGSAAMGVPLDLSDLQSVGQAIGRLRALQDSGAIPAVDAAILNAGAQFLDRRRVSAQGYELTFAVNVLAQHALLRGLEPLMAPSAHVILLGSSTHRGRRQSFGLVPDPQWQDPGALARPDDTPRGGFAAERERGGIAYATSKLALVTLSHAWAERLGRSSRRLNVYDPGLVAGTGLVRGMPGYMDWVWRRIMPAMSVLPKASTPDRTARHAVALALGERHADLHAGYVEIGAVTAAEPVTFDTERQRALWDWLEGALASAALPHLPVIEGELAEGRGRTAREPADDAVGER